MRKKAANAELQEEITNQLLNDNKGKQEQVKSECANCYEYKKIDSESGLCSKCGNN